MNYIEIINHLEQIHPAGKLFLISNILIMICVMVLLGAIIMDFLMFHRKVNIKKKKNSIVETGTMFVFYFIYYGIIKSGLGKISFHPFFVYYLILILGLVFIIIGTVVNVYGRLVLKDNWANQVTIYKTQTLVDKGVYSFVRHPLYASIIWMLIGGSMVYFNYLAFISVIVIFVPMMLYRARQEEVLLSSEIPGYIEYRMKVGMFFPKIK